MTGMSITCESEINARSVRAKPALSPISSKFSPIKERQDPLKRNADEGGLDVAITRCFTDACSENGSLARKKLAAFFAA